MVPMRRRRTVPRRPCSHQRLSTVIVPALASKWSWSFFEDVLQPYIQTIGPLECTSTCTDPQFSSRAL